MTELVSPLCLRVTQPESQLRTGTESETRVESSFMELELVLFTIMEGLCSPVCVWAGACMLACGRVPMCIHVEGRGQLWVSFLRWHSPCFWDRISLWSGTPRPKQSTLAGLSPNFLPSNEIVTMVSKAAYMGPGDEFRSSCLHGKALYWLSYPKTFLQYFNMQWDLTIDTFCT